MKELLKNPITSFLGIGIVVMALADMYRNSVHMENIALVTTGLGLIVASDAKTKLNDKN